MADYPVAGRAVLITGAGSGIGVATARALHERGALVALADLNGGSVDRVAAALGPGRTLAVAVDVTDRTALADAVGAIATRFGGLDIVFANAGVAPNPAATVATIDVDDFERVVAVDLLGVWRTVRAALPQVLDRHGHVLLTSSIYAFGNGTANAPYAMAKAGVEQLGRALRVELAGHGATAGVLYPGWVDTPLVKSAYGGHPTVTQLRTTAFPGFLSKRIRPEQVAAAVVKGIERRAPRIVVPRGWVAASVLRGVVNPLSDRMLVRNAEVQRLLAELEDQARRQGRPEGIQQAPGPQPLGGRSVHRM
jgi:NAD(P)-dependent dehydrogenase (short-subunit alcohol dehydrogenase family)